MLEVKNRDGKSVKILLVGAGGKREIKSQEEFNFLVNLFPRVRTCIPFILNESIARADAKTLAVLAQFLLKKLMRMEVNEERSRIFERLIGATEIELTFLSKTIRLSIKPQTFNLIYQVFIMNQYDINEANAKGKIMVDVGANIGDFTLFCACFGPKRIYAFEPVADNFRVLSENIRKNGFEKIVVPVKKAIGDREFEVEVKADYDAQIGGQAAERAKNRETIQVVTLDSFLKGERIDLLKMDVEGYEENVLRGAAKTIREFKPVLTFSAYHKTTDKVRLPRVVKDIRNDYSIRLNNFYEQDFYCD